MKFYSALLLFILLSCGKRQCDVEQISKNVLNEKMVSGDFILKNQKQETDTLKINDFWESFETEENIGLMVHQTCGHFFDYDYSFQNQVIYFDVERNEEKSILKVSCQHSIGQYEVSNKEPFAKELLIDGANCETNPFRTIVVDKFQIVAIIEKNGDKWVPVQFIPKKL